MYLLPVRLIANDKITEYIDAFLIDFGLVGGIAVFIDQSGLHYSSRILTLHSYLWHTMMIFVAVYLAKKIKLQNYHFIKGVLIYLMGTITATLINIIFNSKGLINMFYISPFHNMEQIVFKQIAIITTQTTAKVIYVISTILAAYIMHELIILSKKLKYNT